MNSPLQQFSTHGYNVFDHGRYFPTTIPQQQQQPMTTTTTSSEDFFDDENQVPTPSLFSDIVEDYLNNLSPKKRDKALVDQERYQMIQQVLKDPRNTAISTAQFRFWVKKMFQLQPGTVDLVCHDSKPVAMREQIYSILVKAHREAHHGGRDKTSALVRRKYSWIPKELVARFVRHCPFCITRRNGGQSPGMYKSSLRYNSNAAAAAAAVAAAATAAAATVNNTTTRQHQCNFDPPPMLCTPSIQEDSDIASSGPPSTENGYDTSPHHYVPSPPRRGSHIGGYVYDREEEEFLHSYGHYAPESKGTFQQQQHNPFHQLLNDAARSTHSTHHHQTTMMADTNTSDNNTPTSTADAAAAFLYQHPSAYMGYSYYYPNVLGIAPACDSNQQASFLRAGGNDDDNTTLPSTSTAGILAHHQEEQQHHASTRSTLPFNLPVHHSTTTPNHFMTTTTHHDDTTTNVLLQSYE